MIDIEDKALLADYLAKRGITVKSHDQIYSLSGGVSCKTMRAGDLVVKQALPKLRVAADWYSDENRYLIEAEGVKWIAQLLGEGATALLEFIDPAQKLFAMRFIPAPHLMWKDALMRGQVEGAIFRTAGTMLARLHQRAAEEATIVQPHFTAYQHFESLRLEAFYSYAAKNNPSVAGQLIALQERTRTTCLTLTHGDFSPKNLLLKDGDLILLDHETIHWGDPAFDLGFATAHFLSKANHLVNERAALLRGALLFFTSYIEGCDPTRWGVDFIDRVILHSLGCTLARVSGRSPLPYLQPLEAARQQEICVQLLTAPPLSYPDLIQQFTASIN